MVTDETGDRDLAAANVSVTIHFVGPDPEQASFGPAADLGLSRVR